MFGGQKLDESIESEVRHCSDCQSNQPAPRKAPLHPWEWPNKPWLRLHVDFAGPFQGHLFLLVVDAHSKWLEAFTVTSTASSTAIQCVRALFARFGLPDTLVSDNGTGFTGKDFEDFPKLNGIRHVTSTPYHPSSNGLVERAVQIVKTGLRKVKEGSVGDRLARVLFSYRTTPHSTTGVTPAELLFGRSLQTWFHKLYPNQSLVVKEQRRQKEAHDNGTRWREFQKGEEVYVRNLIPGGVPWFQGQAAEITGPASYRVFVCESNLIWRRHVDHIWPRYDLEQTSPGAPLLPFPVMQPANSGETNQQEPMGTTSSEVKIDAQDKADGPSALSQPVVTPSIEDSHPSQERRPPQRLQM